MQVGKLPPERLSDLLQGRLGVNRADVLVAPSVGEDCAVLDFGDEVCIVSTDPITGTASGAGWLAVHVSCNDVASSGGEPIGVQLALLLPESSGDELPQQIMDDAHRACTELGISILGGHTEILTSIAVPLVVSTAIGRCPKEKYVTSSGQKVGDKVLVTKSVGLEGTAILAADFSDWLSSVPSSFLDTARQFAAEISAVRDALAARDAGVSAMHDITEGGLYGACLELVQASGLGIRLWEEQVPVRPATRQICRTLGLDPLGLISSGALLITSPNPEAVMASITAAGGTAAVIGEVVQEPQVVVVHLSGEETVLKGHYEDELWRFMKRSGTENPGGL